MLSANTNGLSISALSSIMLLSSPCPYPVFTQREWRDIVTNNPYALKEPSLPSELSLSLQNVASRHLYGGDVYMHAGYTELSRKIARSFNDL
jgi:hypothetical protein